MKYLQRKTKQLLIRPFATKDYNAWKQAYLHIARSKNKWDHGPKPEAELTRTIFGQFLKGRNHMRKNDKFYDLAIFNKKRALVGVVAAMDVSRGISQTAFLGYRIFNNYWRMGYGKEAVRALLDIGFKDIKLHRIEAGIEPGNIRSIKLAKSLGMRREGLKKRAIFLKNRWVDLIMYTLTTEDVGIKFDTSRLRRD